MTRMVTKFWIEDTRFSDVDEGWVKWTEGSEEFVIDVLKEKLSPIQKRFLKQELERHMIGLCSQDQISYLYQGVLDQALHTDEDQLAEWCLDD